MLWSVGGGEVYTLLSVSMFMMETPLMPSKVERSMCDRCWGVAHSLRLSALKVLYVRSMAQSSETSMVSAPVTASTDTLRDLDLLPWIRITYGQDNNHDLDSSRKAYISLVA